MTVTTKDAAMDELLSHLCTTDAHKDPDHANTILEMAASALTRLNGRVAEGHPLGFIRGRIAAYRVIIGQCENEIKQLEGTLKKYGEKE